VRRLLVRLLSLALVYALVLASFDPWDLLGGLVVSAALLVVFRRVVSIHGPIQPPGLLARAVASLPFALAVVRETVAGTWSVALVSAHVRPLPRSAIVAVPIGERSRAGIAASGLTTTFSPGSVLIEVDEERGVMLYHVLDADPDAFRRSQEEFYRRYQRHVIP
jgi:multisubunit Na+/H+ antiporter MnhE subunit